MSKKPNPLWSSSVMSHDRHSRLSGIFLKEGFWTSQNDIMAEQIWFYSLPVTCHSLLCEGVALCGKN
jgi:hypothetical protein